MTISLIPQNTSWLKKMFQLTEEQVEEIQVLESIYGDAFKRK